MVTVTRRGIVELIKALETANKELEEYGERVVWQKDLAERWGVDRTTIYRMERKGKLPPPDIVMGRRRGRFETTVQKFEGASVAQTAAA